MRDSSDVASRAGDPLARIAGGLVVSSQASGLDSLLADPDILVLLARAAADGGADGFRVDGPDVVARLRQHTDRPIIGISKRRSSGFDTYITVSIADALALVRAGAEIVALQATAGSRPAESVADISAAVHDLGGLVMADISGEADAAAAVAAGVDAVATTLVGFTADTAGAARPPLTLVARLSAGLPVPVIVEGGIWTPDDVRASFAAGAHAVVVGSAVTAADLITARLRAGTPKGIA